MNAMTEFGLALVATMEDSSSAKIRMQLIPLVAFPPLPDETSRRKMPSVVNS